MTNYKKNTNGLYALYQSGSEWRESASVKNTDLDDDGKFYKRVDDIYEPITLLNTWNTCDWSVTIDGETRTLKPTVCLTPFELYNITVWKEEAQANQWAKPVKLKERAIELGIWGYFTS